MSNAVTEITMEENKVSNFDPDMSEEKLQDRFESIIMTFATDNLHVEDAEEKWQELSSTFTLEIWSLFSIYLVERHACATCKLHTVLVDFLKMASLKQKQVFPLIISKTIVMIKRLLNANKCIFAPTLQNLGHWLGMATIGQNKPVLYTDLDFKSMLVDAYYKGGSELTYIIPFVIRVLESCRQSRVFKPKNPWTMSIIGLLVEIRRKKNLSNYLNLEIEDLCKALKLEISKIKSSILPEIEEEPSILDYINEHLKNMILNDDETQLTDNLVPYQPKYNYLDLQLSGKESFQDYITIGCEVVLLPYYSNLQLFIRTAIQEAVHNYIDTRNGPIKLAVETCREIITKDFALDFDEGRMCNAARCLIRNIVSAQIIPEQLLNIIQLNVYNCLQKVKLVFRVRFDEISSIAKNISYDNVKFCCAFVQKTCVDKAIEELDKSLANEYELRRRARQEGRTYLDENVLVYQAERMPMAIRLQVGSPSPQQLIVYEEFARSVPGFQPFTERDAEMFMSFPIRSADTLELHQGLRDRKYLRSLYKEHMSQIDDFLSELNQRHELNIIICDNLKEVRESLNVAAGLGEIIFNVMNVIHKCVECLQSCPVQVLKHLKDAVDKYKALLLNILISLQNDEAFGCEWTNLQITRFLIDCNEDIRYNFEAVSIFINSSLVDLSSYGSWFSHYITKSVHDYEKVVDFCKQLIRTFVVKNRFDNSVYQSSFAPLIEKLIQILNPSLRLLKNLHPGSNDYVTKYVRNILIEIIIESSNCIRVYEITDMILIEWINHYIYNRHKKYFIQSMLFFLSKIIECQISNSNNYIIKFCIHICVLVVQVFKNDLKNTSIHVRSMCRTNVDALVHFLIYLIRYSGNLIARITAIKQIYATVVSCVLISHQRQELQFHQLPYHRILINIFLEIFSIRMHLLPYHYDIILDYCHALHKLRPSKAPGFCFAWLELVSHPMFIHNLLVRFPNKYCWNRYSNLIVDVLEYMAPFLSKSKLNYCERFFYDGVLKVILVLVHDFPEFISYYYYKFCRLIPLKCVQLRNLILSAIPKGVIVPNPLTAVEKVDHLNSMLIPPIVLTNFASEVQPLSLKQELDLYLKTGKPCSFATNICTYFIDCESHVNVPLLNVVVMYVGLKAILYLKQQNLKCNFTTICHGSYADLFEGMFFFFDSKGRYLLINAIADHLRFPNLHTLYFSILLLHLYRKMDFHGVQEQIVRVLMERLITTQPYPWGILIVFMELLKNRDYNFWNNEFVTCAPEIEKFLFSWGALCNPFIALHQKSLH